MPPSKRKQARAFQSQMNAKCRALLKNGLPLDHDQNATIVLAYIFRQKLLEPRNTKRSADVARTATAIFELSVQRNPSDRTIDCKKGCSYCCSRTVGISAPEAFLIAEQISSSDAQFLERDAYLARAHETIRIDPDDRFSNRKFCALLKDDACSIYTGRPIVCRSNTSHQVQACIDAFDGKDSPIPVPRSHMFLADRCRMAIYAALRSLNYPAFSYEMSEAVSLVLREDAASERWLNGEDIFAGVQSLPDRTSEMDNTITRIAREILF